MKSCPKLQSSRDSPRTPAKDGDKVAKLREISKKLSPKPEVPFLPHGELQYVAPAKSEAQNSGSQQSSAPVAAQVEARAEEEAHVEEPPRSTDEKLDKIMEMMKGVASKGDLVEMKGSLLKEVETSTKVAISEAVDPLKSELHDLKARVECLEKPQSATGHPDNSRIDQKLESIEAEITKIKTSGANVSNGGTWGNAQEDSDTIVFGGFEKEFRQTAEDWIVRKLKELRLPTALDIYHKGDEFKGLIFARFANAEVATNVVDYMGKKKATIGNSEVWCKPDRPIEIRAPLSLLLSLRRQLIQWG
jgi:archaellum component FlaC